MSKSSKTLAGLISDIAREQASGATPLPVGMGHRRSRSIEDAMETLGDQRRQTTVTIDPDLIDPAPQADRVAVDAGALEELRRSIEAQGQQTPILVRRHPEAEGRYQLAYGHRRLMALKAINADRQRSADGKGRLLALAFVRELDDLQLARAQASENLDRQDLSWIDKALFLRNLTAAYSSETAYDVLRLHKSVASRMRSVMDVIPADIITAIGSAPGIGAPRWLTLAEMFDKFPAEAAAAAREKINVLEVIPVGENGRTIGSDERFLALFNAVARAVKAAGAKGTAAGGPELPEVRTSKTSVQVKFARQHGAFGPWLEARMRSLWDEYVEETKR